MGGHRTIVQDRYVKRRVATQRRTGHKQLRKVGRASEARSKFIANTTRLRVARSRSGQSHRAKERV